MKDAIWVNQITRSYGDFMLDHVSFHVPQGSIVGFVGENGAGKTTTLRAILDLVRLDQGEVEVLGLSGKERKDPRWREQIGVVWDVAPIPEMLTAAQIGKMMRGVYRQWDGEVYGEYLRRFELPEGKSYKDLSRGMRMKLSLAMAMSHKARLLILDEPTGGLDPVVREEILDLFLDFIQEEDHSILISSHIISDLEKVADYIVLIHKGRICFEEEKDRLLERYGIVRCTEAQARALPGRLVVGQRENRFSCEILVNDRGEIARQFPELSVDPAGIEDIMLYTVKYGMQDGREEL